MNFPNWLWVQAVARWRKYISLELFCYNTEYALVQKTLCILKGKDLLIKRLHPQMTLKSLSVSWRPNSHVWLTVWYPNIHTYNEKFFLYIYIIILCLQKVYDSKLKIKGNNISPQKQSSHVNSNFNKAFIFATWCAWRWGLGTEETMNQ